MACLIVVTISLVFFYFHTMSDILKKWFYLPSSSYCTKYLTFHDFFFVLMYFLCPCKWPNDTLFSTCIYRFSFIILCLFVVECSPNGGQKCCLSPWLSCQSNPRADGAKQCLVVPAHRNHIDLLHEMFRTEGISTVNPVAWRAATLTQ